MGGEQPHPARAIPFDDLLAGLTAARNAGLVSRKFDPATGRSLYCYTSRCVYEDGWETFSLMSRGLILHEESKQVVATPFPKFFNAGERGAPIPDLPFEAFEKLDGSLVIIHHHDSRWCAATKGAFDSPQAIWAEARLAAQDVSDLVVGTTYLVEAIYPENRIVVHYPESVLVLLAAYRDDGIEVATNALQQTATWLGWRMAARHYYATFSDLAAKAKTLPASKEGFVLRFASGLRLKVKGDEYRRIHALISRCTPLAMWEAMAADDDMQAIRHDLPEEFWDDFDGITTALRGKLDGLLARVGQVNAEVASLSDKDLGLRLSTLPADVRPFLFASRKHGDLMAGKSRDAVFRAIRPIGNLLSGYVPSYAMNRVAEDVA